MTETPADPLVASRREREAQAKSAWYMLAVTALAAGGSTLLRGDGLSPVGFARNAILAIAAWCALLPALRHGGDRFGRQFHWTGVLFVAPMALTAITLLAMWHILTS